MLRPTHWPAATAWRTLRSTSTNSAHPRPQRAGWGPSPSRKPRADRTSGPNGRGRRMHGAVDALKKECAGIRTGRASVNLLDPVMVEAYGQRMPLNQVGTVSAPEPRLLTVNVWDKGLVVSTAKA